MWVGATRSLMSFRAGERELADVGRRDALPDVLQVRLERLGTLGQTHEHQPLPLREVDGRETVVALVEQLHPIEMRHAAQHAVEPIGPAVVLAHQHVRVAVLHGEGPTAVPAHVEERAQRPVLPPHHDDRLPRDLGDHMVARLRELMAVGHVLPRGREDRVAIERVEPRVRVPRRRDGLRACERVSARASGRTRKSTALSGGKEPFFATTGRGGCTSAARRAAGRAAARAR